MTEPQQDAAKEEEKGRMSFGAHLDELRTRLFKGLIVIAVIFFVGWGFFSDFLIGIIMRPHLQAVERVAQFDPPVIIEKRLGAISSLEPIFFSLKASMVAAFLIGLPLLLFQVWSFVSVGLHKKEKRAVRRYMPWSLAFAAGGLAFCYFIFYPTILTYLYGAPNGEFFRDDYRAADYFGLLIMFGIALAVVFQLPLILSGFAAGGLVDAKLLRKYRRHFILCAFIVGAMITPPEPMSQFLMALPTVVLYEVGILLVAVQVRKRPKT